jgi:hypothetical protein
VRHNLAKLVDITIDERRQVARKGMRHRLRA